MTTSPHSYYTIGTTDVMRVIPILKRCHQRAAIFAVSCALAVSQVFLPALSLAERVDPELDLSSPSATIDQQSDVTNVQDLVQPADYQMMGIAQKPSDSTIPTLKAKVDVDKEFVPDVNFDETHTLDKGDKLILVIMDMVASGYSENGDAFNARLKEAVERDGKILIPKGALVKGHIESTDDPGKMLNKRGKMVLAFDYILMPDGRKVPFKSEYTKGDNALMAVGRAVGSGIGGTISGTIRGVLLGLKFGGLQGAALSHGATLIGGGGLGAVAGLGSGIAQSGDHVLLNEGDVIKVALEEPLKLPVVNVTQDTQNEIHAEGLTVQVTDYNLGRDPFKTENLINLKLKIDNHTTYTFGSFDMALMDEYNNVYTVSPFGNSDSMLVFQIGANSQFAGTASFSVKSPDLRHYLVFYKPYTREVIAKISLTEALKALSAKGNAHAASRKDKASPKDS